MKGKGLTYALVLIVGVIWYQVFIRVKSNLVADEATTTSLTGTANGKRLSKREQFSLQANYRDPFTGNLSAASDNAAAPVVNNLPPQFIEPPQPKPKPLPPQWPAIRYYGLVRKTTSSLPRTLLNIDGAFYQLKQGDAVLDNILVKKTYRDSVVINYRKQNRTFYKMNL